MQKSVSLSSAEAEFFGAMLAARDVVYLRDLLVDFDISVDSASSLWSDSGSAVKMAFDPVSFRNTKHIMRAAEFLRDLVNRGEIIVHHASGRVMVADLLTKAVARPMYLDLIRLLDNYAVSGVVCPA